MFHCFNGLGKFAMVLAPCSRCRKANWLTIYKNQCLIARNSTCEILLLEDSIINGLNRHKGSC